MNVYIKEWANKSASILTANGQVVWTFSSTDEARQACRDWCSIVQVCGELPYDEDETPAWNLA